MKPVRVKVIYIESRNKHVLRWLDPETKEWREKTAVASRKESEKLGHQLEADLQNGRYVAPSKLAWADFRLAYEDDKLASLSVRSQQCYGSSLNHIERILKPDLLSELTTVTLSRFQAKLRTEGKREATIAQHLRHIKAALNWAKEMDMLVEMPKVPKPKRARHAQQRRGRAVTLDEFKQMLRACRSVRPSEARMWRRFLRGLWVTGLRLGEAMALSWDEGERLSLEVSGEDVFIRIQAEGEKGFRDRRHVLTPDASELLLRTPEADRRGRVFEVARAMGPDRVSRIVCKIGKKAEIMVNKEQSKFASAHDLRRAFATRWARIVQPMVLKELMRHDDIDTTMSYYVETRSEEMARELRRAANLANHPRTTAETVETVIV